MSVIRAMIVAMLLAALLATIVIGYDVTMSKLKERGIVKDGSKNLPSVKMPFSVDALVSYSAFAVLTVGITAALVTTYFERTRLLGVVRVSDFVRHLLIFGATGSGKTSVARRAIELALSKKIRVIVIDWKGLYACY
ncbi:MAG: DUF87 domain-containing protein [Desulfurococcales archaeon]|nr:DUF87 domain-containing protein [Desulfurococcales archaeon]